tara:strand:+ start:1725 stop:1982 length:258 start_codon:yes stop_codon:yes gene_type:complete
MREWRICLSLSAGNDASDKLKGSKMADFRFTSESFASTEVMVEPVTEAGERMFAEFFGNACSVTLRKSGGLEFSEVAAERGLVVS